jgi:uncharacterized protein (DUF927 family)
MDTTIQTQKSPDKQTELVEEFNKILIKPKEFFGKFYATNWLLEKMTAMYLEDEIEVQKLLNEANNRGVAKSDTASILKTLKNQSKLIKKQQLSSVVKTTIKTYIPDAPVSDQAVLPSGYFFTQSQGISYSYDTDKDDASVSLCPIFITEIKHNKSTNIYYATLLWREDSVFRSITKEKNFIAKKSLIVDLASHGFPITTTNADKIINYLFAYENVNSHCIDKIAVTDKLGWTDDMEGFLWGNRFLSSHDHASPPDKKPSMMFFGSAQGDEQIADGFRSKGDYRTWISLVNEVLIYPDVAFLLYASLATPLLPVLGSQNFSLELSNQSSSGKTTALLLGASAWGAPELHSSSFVNTWYATPVWIGRAASILNGLPLYLDETKLVHSQDRRDRAGDIVSKTMFMITAGRDKARGNLEGTARTESFRTILFSTGESPSLDLSNDGGLRGRLIDLWGNPFLKTDNETKSIVDKINWTIQDHYGHAGPRVVQYIIDHKDQWALWRKAYREANGFLCSSESMSPIEMRLSEYFAFVTTAIPIIHAAIPELRRDRHVKDLLESAWNRSRKEARESDIGVKSMHIVYELILNNHDRLYTKGKYSQGIKWDNGQFIGMIDLDETGNWTFVGLTTQTLKELLQKNNFKIEDVRRIWKSKGWLDLNQTSKGFQRQAPIPGTSDKSHMGKLNLYCIKKEAFAFEE